MTDYTQYNNSREILEAAQRGDLSPYEAQVLLANNIDAWNRGFGWSNAFSGDVNPWLLTAEQEKALNSLIDRFNSQNGLSWQAEQLQALGLSNSGVLQTGAAHTAVDNSNIAQRDKEAKLQARTRIASSMIRMAGSMMSSGIYGGALRAVKGAAGQAASLSAHSASSALNSNKISDDDRAAYWAQPDNDNEILKFFANR